MPAGREVVGFGSVTVDEFWFLGAPLAGDKARVVRTETHYGGNVATALAACARLGTPAAFLGHLPGAARWSGIAADLRSHGVDLSRARTDEATDPIQATVLVDPSGERFIAYDDQTAVGAPADLALEPVRAAGALLLDAYAPEHSLRVVRAARDAGVPVVADLEFGEGPAYDDLIARVDHLVLPAVYAAARTGHADPAAAVEALWTEDRAAVVVTAGADGCWFRTPDDARIRHQAAFSVPVVDTTGCGDVFHGAYCSGLVDGLPVQECVELAARAASVCAGRPGGRSQLPTRADLAVAPAH